METLSFCGDIKLTLQDVIVVLWIYINTNQKRIYRKINIRSFRKRISTKRFFAFLQRILYIPSESICLLSSDYMKKKFNLEMSSFGNLIKATSGFTIKEEYNIFFWLFFSWQWKQTFGQNIQKKNIFFLFLSRELGRNKSTSRTFFFFTT